MNSQNNNTTVTLSQPVYEVESWSRSHEEMVSQTRKEMQVKADAKSLADGKPYRHVSDLEAENVIVRSLPAFLRAIGVEKGDTLSADAKDALKDEWRAFGRNSAKSHNVALPVGHLYRGMRVKWTANDQLGLPTAVDITVTTRRKASSQERVEYATNRISSLDRFIASEKARWESEAKAKEQKK